MLKLVTVFPFWITHYTHNLNNRECYILNYLHLPVYCSVRIVIGLRSDRPSCHDSSVRFHLLNELANIKRKVKNTCLVSCIVKL